MNTNNKRDHIKEKKVKKLTGESRVDWEIENLL